jgi:ABC-2 type transport system ATP-binding protein
MNPAIVLTDVRRSFGNQAVLRGVTASAAPGKVIGLLGRNGEGKTTLFKILLDMLAADSGSVQVLGQSPDGSGSLRQSVGYVPERPAFHGFMTVGEVFAFRSRLFRNWHAQKAAKLMKDLGLDAATGIRGASKGTLGKVAWVCAAAHDPSVFLLDEPTSGLDALVREDVLNHLIGELHDGFKTLLIANHRMEELAGVLDEVWLLQGGVIRSVHPVETLRTQACRLSGRLKEGAALPAGLPVVSLRTDGPVLELVVFERSLADMLAASGSFENLERAPLALGESLKYLLRLSEGGRHD